MSAAPDLAEPVLGFRAWYVDREGGLIPLGFQACTWQPGVNRAECHADGQGPRHDAPQPDCKCGLYAFHDPGRLPKCRQDVCVGAVAAWGNLEVHEAGFRAEFACVLALSGETLEPRYAKHLGRVAERYGVSIVPVDELAAAGLEHARPIVKARARDEVSLPFEAYGPGRRHWRLAALPEDLHYEASAHTWTRLDGETAIVGLAAPARTLLSFSPSFSDWAIDEIDRGALLATATGRADGQVKILSPISGRLVSFNSLLAWAPHVLRTSPYRHGWVARLEPRDWQRESKQLLSGADGVTEYIRKLNRPCQGPSPIYLPRATWHRDPILLPGSAPAEPSADTSEETNLQKRLTCFLEQHLCRDRDLMRLLSSAGLLLRLELDTPGTLIELGAKGRAVTLRMSPTTAHALFLGRLDPPRALALGRIVLEGDRAAYGVTMSILKRVFPRYRSWIGEAKTG